MSRTGRKAAKTDAVPYYLPDGARWDESILRWCRETGFNLFGSGPVPIVRRHGAGPDAAPAADGDAEGMPSADGDGKDRGKT